MNPVQMQTFVANPSPSQDVARQKRKKYLLWMSRLTLGVTVFCLFGGVAEAAMEGCIRYPNDRWCHHYQRSLGQGIWCSVIPIVAAILGLFSSSKSSTKTQVKSLLGFSIVGAVSMCVMLIIEFSLAFGRYDSMPSPFRSLQVVLGVAATIGAILLIILSSLSCSLGGCSCQNGQKVMYVAYNPAGGVNFPLQTTGVPNPQVIMMNAPTNAPMMTVAPNPQAAPINPAQMQQTFGYTPQGYPIMFVQPPMQVAGTSQQPQQVPPQPQPSTSELPQYEETETPKVAL